MNDTPQGQPTLDACPFCGSAAYAAYEVWSDFRYDWPWYVHCKDCVGTVGGFKTEEEAIAAWNRRTTHAQLAEAQQENERLKAELAEALRNLMVLESLCGFVDEERLAQYRELTDAGQEGKVVNE